MKVVSRLERDGPATVTTLAQAEGIRPQSMGATGSALKAAGLVSGTADPADGRQTILSLTTACRESIHAAREDWLMHAIRTKREPREHAQLATAIKDRTRIERQSPRSWTPCESPRAISG